MTIHFVKSYYIIEDRQMMKLQNDFKLFIRFHQHCITYRSMKKSRGFTMNSLWRIKKLSHDVIYYIQMIISNCIIQEKCRYKIGVSYFWDDNR